MGLKPRRPARDLSTVESAIEDICFSARVLGANPNSHRPFRYAQRLAATNNHIMLVLDEAISTRIAVAGIGNPRSPDISAFVERANWTLIGSIAAAGQTHLELLKYCHCMNAELCDCVDGRTHRDYIGSASVADMQFDIRYLTLVRRVAQAMGDERISVAASPIMPDGYCFSGARWMAFIMRVRIAADKAIYAEPIT